MSSSLENVAMDTEYITRSIQCMADEEIAFNEIVRRLQISPTQANKILKGEANLTLNSIAHVAALLNKQPKIVFEERNAS